MRKLLSSIFILLLLMITLWGISAWYFGNKSVQQLETVFANSKSSLFDTHKIEIDKSLFSSTLQARVSINQQHPLGNLFAHLIDQAEEFSIKLEIQNGPLLISQTGIQLGQSIFEIDINKLNTHTNHNQQVPDYETNKLSVISRFDDSMHYSLPISSSFGRANITGFYSPKLRQNKGKIALTDVSFKAINKLYSTQQINIDFQSLDKTQINNEISFTSDAAELLIQSGSGKSAIELSTKGKISLSNQQLNSDSLININNKSNAELPFHRGNLTLNINALSLYDLNELWLNFDKMNNQQQQIDWILEEQAEVPEGQDQIWQRQDRISQLSQKIPDLIDQLLLRNGASIVNFTLKSQSKNQLSTVSGEVLPLQQPLESTTSLASALQIKAKVSLGDFAFKTLKEKLPLKTKQFDLIYKNNKLLMQ